MDAEVQKYLDDHFVNVWVDDQKEDQMAKKLGLSQEGYPNIAVYAVGNEFLGRVIGFGGKEPWFKEVKQVVAVGEKLTEAKAKAEKDPAENIALAEVLKSIPGRTKDAQAALEQVPVKAKASKAFKAIERSLASRDAWDKVNASFGEALKGVRNVDEARPKATKVLDEIDAFLKEYAGADREVDPKAYAKKGFVLVVILDRPKEAIEIAKKLLDEYPESPQAKRLLRGLTPE